VWARRAGAARRIDVSTLLCVFEFARDDAAEAMLAASIPNTTMTKPEAFFWVVDSIDSNHVGHSQPYRECEKNLYLTYAMKSTAKVMADSGCSDADIGNYLSSRGCSGTSHRLKYNVDAVRQELEDYTVISQPGETEAEALLRVLKETKCRFIYLYTTAPTDFHRNAGTHRERNATYVQLRLTSGIPVYPWSRHFTMYRGSNW
jgi:hypothetical protein